MATLAREESRRHAPRDEKPAVQKSQADHPTECDGYFDEATVISRTMLTAIPNAGSDLPREASSDSIAKVNGGGSLRQSPFLSRSSAHRRHSAPKLTPWTQTDVPSTLAGGLGNVPESLTTVSI